MVLLKRIWLQLLSIAILVCLDIYLNSIEGTVHFREALSKGIKFLGVWIGVWAIRRMLSYAGSTHVFSQQLSGSHRKFIFRILRIFLFIIGLLTSLDILGVRMTPILASLGVGSLAVALALQDTLSNLFSGMYLLADRPLAAGDFIRTESGIEGEIKRIGWRSTQLLTQGNLIVNIPNAKLASSIITNFSLPTPHVQIIVPVLVSYDSNLLVAESTAIHCIKELYRHLYPDEIFREPVVRFTDFAESGIQMNVVFSAPTFERQFILKSEAIKSLHLALREKRIEIPYPRREFVQRSIT